MRKARWAVVTAAGVAAVAFIRRARSGSSERAELYFDDGSMVSLVGSPEAERLILLARAVLGTTR